MKKTITETKREYYILAGDKGMKDLLEKSNINLSPECFLIIKENSKIGKLIKKEAKRRFEEICKS